MKLVQKILSHGLLIAFIVAAFFAYTNRGKLFPQWFGKTEKVAQQTADDKPDASAPELAERKVSRPKPEKTVTKRPVAPVDETPGGSAEKIEAQPAPAAPAESEPKAPQPGEPLTAVEATPPAVAAAGTPEPAQPAEPDIAAAGGDEQAPGVTGETPARAVETEQVASTAAAGPESAAVPQPAATMEPATQATEPAPTAEADVAALRAGGGEQVSMLPPQAVPAPSVDVQLEKQLEEARRHYWQRDMRGAAAAYQALSEAYPQNPDVWGEMGNFYFNLRQRKPAGEAYSRCIELLIDQGEQVRARQLLNVLYRLDALKARELETRMQQAGG